MYFGKLFVLNINDPQLRTSVGELKEDAEVLLKTGFKKVLFYI
jgi:hypothetical protein